MDKQGQFLNTELGEKKSASVWRSLQGQCNQMHLTVNAYEDAWQKFSIQKDLFCVSVCMKFGANQNITQRRCCHTVWWFNCSVLFSLWFGEDLNLLQLKSSLCGIFVFKMQYLTFLFVCDFNTTVSSQSIGVHFLFHAGAEHRNELVKGGDVKKSFSALVSCLLCWTLQGNRFFSH